MQVLLRNYWYPACAASRLDSNPKAVRLLDQDLVLFRDSERRAHALLDRCCHRGAKLSVGQVNQGRVACRYHGWEYDGAGRCVHIPSLVASGRIPNSFMVPAFPCFERDSYVWLWMGDGPPHPREPPAIPEFADFEWLQGSTPFNCAALRMIENNMDWCHPVFTHENTHPMWFMNKAQGFQEVVYELRLTENGCQIIFPPTQNAEDPVPEEGFTDRFELPCAVFLRTQFPRMSYRVIMFHVPTGPDTFRLEWMQTRQPGSGVTWMGDENEIFKQDRSVVETTEPAYRGDGGGEFECSVEADASTLLVRRIVKLAAAGEWERKRVVLMQRRLVRVRS
jgi:nitrite reductase/ring-hydroxylating ferredoxin subunit